MQQYNDRTPPDLATERGPHASSLDEIFSRYQQEIFRLCFGMLGDVPEAEDATQEVFLRAQRAWHRFDPKRAAARTWLGHIAMNYCHSFLQRKQLGNRLSRLLLLPAHTGQPYQQSEDQIDLLAALRVLDAHHRSVVILRYYLEWTCAEIADVLQINEGTVRSRLSIARRRLRTALEENNDDATR